MHRFSLRSGRGEFGASPNYPPLNSDIYARILGLSPNFSGQEVRIEVLDSIP